MSGPAQLPRDLRVVLVEDSADDAELIERALRRAGAQAAPARAETGQELERALDEAPDVVLCDFHMPSLRCETVLERVARRGRRTPVIVVSRHATREDFRTLAERGAAAFVPKDRLSGLAQAIVTALRAPAG